MIDADTILAPVPGENPAGEDLRYTPVYDEIKEARRADDPLDRGDWNRELKTSDWDTVIRVSTEVLTEKTKDLQIAAWLTEALIRKQGFDGLIAGLTILRGFLENFWDHVYPPIDDGDLDYRVGPFEFMNDKLWSAIKEIPVTDSSAGPGYSWFKWQESRKVGYESDILNKFGDVDDKRKSSREELIAEGKLTGEDFDAAVAVTSKAFYVNLEAALSSCLEEFDRLDAAIDDKFGSEAPRLSEIKGAIEDCMQLTARILKDKKQIEPDPVPREEPMDTKPNGDIASSAIPENSKDKPADDIPAASPSSFTAASLGAADQGSLEQALWQDALKTVAASGIKEALEKLRNAAHSAPSVRQKNRYRLLIAKLCLRVSRADLARPVIEQLYALIEELNLERWESPIWIAEVLDAYYQCLTSQGASDEDIYKANNELFQKLCTKDITKAMIYNR
ncbi:MAG TPA: type VI secretion system protein TssA [Deltaproteobacteria bacterium]|nr:type VI secretion system protein TssA [Deltaproteobacteria bacterium]